jgi:hypothetical protein
VVYYCEASEDHKLTFHRGGKEGVIIATVEPCLDHEGDTEIYFLPQTHHANLTHPGSPLNPSVQQSTSPPSPPSPPSTPSSVTLSHTHHHFPSLHGKSTFTYHNKKFHWQGHAELHSDAKDDLVARFEASWFEGKGHRIGVLDVMEMGMGMLDLVVFSGLIVQERTEEHKLAVSSPLFSDLPCFPISPVFRSPLFSDLPCFCDIFMFESLLYLNYAFCSGTPDWEYG